jgi:cell division septation protein DedD
MEDQTSWKSHTFTLLVFTGIVVLCSIFFILGMLVGRTQGQKLAFAVSANAPAKADAKTAAKEESRPDLTFYDSVRQSDPPSLEPPAIVKIEPAVPEPPKAPRFPKIADPEKAPAAGEAEPPRTPEKVLNYQIGAVRKSGDADKLLAEVKKKGFKAFILAPAPDDANPYFRVQVGPFADMLEADDARKKLASAGYQPILKK